MQISVKVVVRLGSMIRCLLEDFFSQLPVNLFVNAQHAYPDSKFVEALCLM